MGSRAPQLPSSTPLVMTQLASHVSVSQAGLFCLSLDSACPAVGACDVCLACGTSMCVSLRGWDTSSLGALCDCPPLSSAPPTIWGSNETSEVAVMEGLPVRFLCEARGAPAPDISWFKDGAPLPASAEAVYTRGGRQLQLGRAQGSQAGLYTCKASNAVGVTEKATRLEVYGERPGLSSERWPAG